MIDKLKLIVDYAYDHIPIYRRLYQRKPELRSVADFLKLSYVRLSDFVTCKIEDVISDAIEAISILPPIENKTISPFPRLESSHDRDMRYEVFYFMLGQMDIGKDASFVVLTDPTYSYFCGEIVSNLLFYKYPTSMIILRDHSDDEIRNWISKLQPDYLIIGTRKFIRDISEWGISNVITINQHDINLSNPPLSPFAKGGSFIISHYDIYAISEIGWIGIKKNDSAYIYPDDYFYIESDPTDDILVITTLTSELLPFIRYKTTDKAIILDNNHFQITYIGEH